MSILGYGHPTLRTVCKSVAPDYPHLKNLVEDMWITMHAANGCGLAASQIGKPIRLFVVDSTGTYAALNAADKKVFFAPGDEGIREVFLNATIVDRSVDQWTDDEGCLSIPGVAQPVSRPWSITIEYVNSEFEKVKARFTGITARMIQHEYDHTLGVLYLDYLQPLTRRLMSARLEKIRKGKVRVQYPMVFVG